jgi:transcriptional regulator with XRE-family HTH domain
MRINEKLKTLRMENGLTQTQLAKSLKLGQTTIAAYENGTHDPQIFSLIAYADYFKCSVDYLVGRENDMGFINIKNGDLTDDEKRILDGYRELNNALKDMALQTVEIMRESTLNAKNDFRGKNLREMKGKKDIGN